ncbi:MAG: hypothetical protein WC365_08870 [Candidatus Babeliales bacterium]|jgi:hypothetical protein
MNERILTINIYFDDTETSQDTIVKNLEKQCGIKNVDCVYNEEAKPQ